MPLENFGSILNFAEELEKHDLDFYQALSENPACAAEKALFERFAADTRKNIQTVQRTRRENVTEMILEPIRNFNRTPYRASFEPADSMTFDSAMAASREIERRAHRYYVEAALKLKALPEVARALSGIAKKHGSRLDSLGDR
jgi:rubrerythrin